MVQITQRDIADTPVTKAIKAASRSTGVGFDYLLRTAQRESSLDPKAKASTSSAAGLYQFIDSTWLATLKEAGPQLGYASEAEAISRTSSGRYFINDASRRREIMDLRYDPQANAAMAGAFTQRNQTFLASTLGRAPTEGELYAAHVLGPQGAAKLIGMASGNPDAKASTAFPEAAAANRGIFYNRNGSARGAADVLSFLTRKHGNAPMPPAGSTLVAAQETTTDNQAETGKNPRALFTRQSNGRMVDNVFAAEGRGAVSTAVRELWGRPAPASSGQIRTAALEAPARPSFFPASEGMGVTPIVAKTAVQPVVSSDSATGAPMDLLAMRRARPAARR